VATRAPPLLGPENASNNIQSHMPCSARGPCVARPLPPVLHARAMPAAIAAHEPGQPAAARPARRASAVCHRPCQCPAAARAACCCIARRPCRCGIPTAVRILIYETACTRTHPHLRAQEDDHMRTK
jgi:hypothetical protein